VDFGSEVPIRARCSNGGEFPIRHTFSQSSLDRLVKGHALERRNGECQRFGDPNINYYFELRGLPRVSPQVFAHCKGPEIGALRSKHNDAQIASTFVENYQ
jgi:hypothetical protein